MMRAAHVPLAALVLGACSGALREPDVPAAPEPPLTRARGDIEAGRVEAGVRALEEWLREPGATDEAVRVETLRWAAHGRTLLGDPERALDHLDDALGLAGHDPWLHYARGTALHTIGEYELALDAYGAALERDPRHVKAAQWRGYTLALLKRHTGAIAEYERALVMLDEARADEIATWGARLEDLQRWTRAALADSLDALGEHDAAECSRARGLPLDD